MCLRQAADKSIDVIGRAISLREFGLKIGIGSHIGPGSLGRQSQSGSHSVIAGRAVIATTLDIERGEIESRASVSTDNEIAHRIDNKDIHLFWLLISQP